MRFGCHHAAWAAEAVLSDWRAQIDIVLTLALIKTLEARRP